MVKLDSLSINCIIIAVFGLAVCINLILTQAEEIYSASKYYENPKSAIKRRSIFITLLTAGILLLILNIVGIKKRNDYLMVPAVLGAFGTVAYLAYDFAAHVEMPSEPRYILQFVMTPILILGGCCIVTYPKISLFNTIRREKAVKTLKTRI